MLCRIFCVFYVMMFLLGTFPVHAANLTAEQILQKVDDYNNEPKDSTMDIKMVVREANGEEKVRLMTMYQRGDRQRLIRFKAPADVKDMTLLMEDKSLIYTYLPQYNKIRRIAVHNLKQGFLGSDFSFDDMNMTRFLDYYAPTLSGETETEYILDLPRKPDTESGSPKLKIWVLKDKPFVTRMEHMNENGNLERIETRSNLQIISNREIQTLISMETQNPKHFTTQQVQEAKFNTGLSEDFFSRRNLSKR